MSVARWVRACAGTCVVVLSLAACGSSPSVTEGSSNVSDAGAPASDSTDSIDSTDSTPAPAQSGTQNAPNTEPTQGDLQSTRTSQVGVHNNSCRRIWVILDAGWWVDNPPPLVDGWRPIEPGAEAFIMGDGGSSVSSAEDIEAYITSEGGPRGGPAGRPPSYGIYASNTWLLTTGKINFNGGERSHLEPAGPTRHVQGGLIDDAVFVYTTFQGNTEYWDVTIVDQRPCAAPTPTPTPTTVPGVPGSVTATAGVGRAKVSWAAPTNGGSGITWYTVASSPGGRTVTTIGTGTAATFTGLTNGTAYTFTVTATNAVGTGAASEPSNAVTPRTCATGGGAADMCVVGDTGPGGGIVFYVNEANATGSRYLEAAPNTWNGGGDLDPGIVWCSNTSTAITGAFGTVIGTGKANTDLMVAVGACTSGAANSVRGYPGGGVSWFLPSKDELNQLYLEKDVVGGFAASLYWSSSQAPGEAVAWAWVQYFVNGNQGQGYKSNHNRVRPVRAF